MRFNALYTVLLTFKIMGAIYKACEPRKQKSRYIYNRDRLHKVGWQPKHKYKYRILRKEFEQLKRNNFNCL